LEQINKTGDEIVVGRNLEADKLVEVFHYSGYIPSNIQFCATMKRDGIAIASIFYSIPATRWSEEVLELCRLVRNEEIVPKPILTSLISFSIKQIRRERKFDLLVSFADSTHSHHGGIYQAASWNYHTLRKPSHDGFIIDGDFVPRRTCNHRWGTSSRTKLVEILEAKGTSCVPHLDKGKHIYWKALDNNGKRKAERLRLTKSVYPKPDVDDAKLLESPILDILTYS
jgi:hypothetical protein